MPQTSSSTREISRTSSTDLVESVEEIHSGSFARSSADFLRQPTGLLSTNVSVVAVEHSVATTGRRRRFGALSDVSFDVELVSSNSDSSCSDLALMSKEVGTSSLISPTKQRSTNGRRGARSAQTDESPITRLMQSAPDIAPVTEPRKELVSRSRSTKQIGRDQDKCHVFGRHSLNSCFTVDRHGLGDAGLFKEDYINAFHSCKAKLRKDPKHPFKICSLGKHTRSVRPELEVCIPSACSKLHSPSRAARNRPSSPKRDSKATNSQADGSNQEPVILSRSRMLEGENSNNKNSGLGSNSWSFERASTGPRTEESWIKRLVSKLFKCISSDGTTDERWAEIWNSEQHY